MLQPLEGEVLNQPSHRLTKRERKRLARQQEWENRRPKSTRYQEEWKLFKSNRWKKRNNQNKHHLLNRCRGGTCSDSNLVWACIEKHNLFHKIFHNDDPEYIIIMLDRLMSMKGYQRFRGVRVIIDED